MKVIWAHAASTIASISLLFQEKVAEWRMTIPERRRAFGSGWPPTHKAFSSGQATYLHPLRSPATSITTHYALAPQPAKS